MIEAAFLLMILGGCTFVQAFVIRDTASDTCISRNLNYLVMFVIDVVMGLMIAALWLFATGQFSL